MKTKIEQLRSWIAESKRMVFFGGAGVSTESGIPDFRSVDGLYHQKFDYPPETIISHSFFLNNPEYFYRFYREKMLPLGFEPNVTHRVLARLEQEGHLAAVVTQNIDGLHQKAGSKRVYELHGSVLRNYCMKCGKFYPAEFIRDAKGIPAAPAAAVKPDVVLYEEALDEKTHGRGHFRHPAGRCADRRRNEPHRLSCRRPAPATTAATVSPSSTATRHPMTTWPGLCCTPRSATCSHSCKEGKHGRDLRSPSHCACAQRIPREIRHPAPERRRAGAALGADLHAGIPQSGRPARHRGL